MPKSFKINNCDCGFTYKGVSYIFDHVDEVTVEDPQTTHIGRGMNATSESGVVYEEGLSEPIKLTQKVMEIPVAVYNLLVQIHKERARVEAFTIDRTDGSKRVAKKAIITQEPRQLSITEGKDSLYIEVSYETFKLDTVLKEATEEAA